MSNIATAFSAVLVLALLCLPPLACIAALFWALDGAIRCWRDSQ